MIKKLALIFALSCTFCQSSDLHVMITYKPIERAILTDFTDIANFFMHHCIDMCGEISLSFEFPNANVVVINALCGDNGAIMCLDRKRMRCMIEYCHDNETFLEFKEKVDGYLKVNGYIEDIDDEYDFDI